MITNGFYSHEFQGDYDLVSIGRLDLEEGGTIPDCQLAVTTWGELNSAKDNVILITTWFSGTHQIWRDVYVGPGAAIRFHQAGRQITCADVFRQRPRRVGPRQVRYCCRREIESSAHGVKHSGIVLPTLLAPVTTRAGRARRQLRQLPILGGQD